MSNIFTFKDNGGGVCEEFGKGLRTDRVDVQDLFEKEFKGVEELVGEEKTEMVFGDYATKPNYRQNIEERDRATDGSIVASMDERWDGGRRVCQIFSNGNKFLWVEDIRGSVALHIDGDQGVCLRTKCSVDTFKDGWNSLLERDVGFFEQIKLVTPPMGFCSVEETLSVGHVEGLRSYYPELEDSIDVRRVLRGTISKVVNREGGRCVTDVVESINDVVYRGSVEHGIGEYPIPELKPIEQ